MLMYSYFGETRGHPEQADSMAPFQNALTKMCVWPVLSREAEGIEGEGGKG